MEILIFDHGIVGEWTCRVASKISARVSVGVGQVQYAIDRKRRKSESLCSSTILVRVPYPKLSRPKPKIQICLPEARRVILHEPSVSSTILPIKLANDVFRITEPTGGCRRTGRDIGGREVDNLLIFERRRGGVAEPGKIATKDDVAIGSLGNRIHGTVEALEWHVRPLPTDPDDRVRRVGPLKVSADVDAARLLVAQERID